jgi:hypothetical protein
MHMSLLPRPWTRVLGTIALVFALTAIGLPEAQAQQQKPNILVIMGDDIGWFNPSAYHRGLMGYQTPNIDRIAKEGAMFTDWYGQQSCTAFRLPVIRMICCVWPLTARVAAAIAAPETEALPL